MVDNLGGFGVFGVELFVKGEDVWFSEVSPRPHDTGLVTLVSQDLSEFALHARAILGLPIPAIRQMGASASAVILPEGDSGEVAYTGLEHALAELDTQLRLFGKPELKGRGAWAWPWPWRIRWKRRERKPGGGRGGQDRALTRVTAQFAACLNKQLRGNRRV